MLKFNKVAITGGLSSGKSSVCQFLKEFGAHVENADEIVHRLLSPLTQLGQQVIDLLGHDKMHVGPLDRKEIAKKVFQDEALLKKLEDLLHPAVQDSLEKAYLEANKRHNASFFVAEVPLLFETNSDTWFDATVAISADPKVCQSRFKETTGYPENEFNRRMARQFSQEEKQQKATYVIRNLGTLEDLKKSTKTIYQQLITRFNEESDH